MRRASRSRNPFIITGVIYAIPLVAAGAMVVLGVRSGQPALYVGGGVGLVFVAATAPLAFLLIGLGVRFRESASIRRAIEELRDNSMLSDNAKRALFRDSDMPLLRSAFDAPIPRCAPTALAEQKSDTRRDLHHGRSAQERRSAAISVDESRRRHHRVLVARRPVEVPVIGRPCDSPDEPSR